MLNLPVSWVSELGYCDCCFAPCSSLRPPSNRFSSRNLRSQPLSCPRSPGPATIFKLLITNQSRAPRFVRIILPRWRPPSTAWLTCHCGPPTPTSLWASISTGMMWLWRAGATFSTNQPKRSVRAPSGPLKIQNQWGSQPSSLPGCVEAAPRRVG